jgi:hypothetical protein
MKALRQPHFFRAILALCAGLAACSEPPDPAEQYLMSAYGLGIHRDSVLARGKQGYGTAPATLFQGGLLVWDGQSGRDAYAFTGDTCGAVQRARLYDSEEAMMEALQQKLAELRALGLPMERDVSGRDRYVYDGQAIQLALSAGPDPLSRGWGRRYVVQETFARLADVRQADAAQPLP